MTERSDKELLDVLGIKIEKEENPQKSSLEERIIYGFEEVQRFFERFNRLPENLDDRDIFERLYAVRLNQLRQTEEYKTLLAPLDHQGLLKVLDDNDCIKIAEELSDTELLAKLGVEPEVKKISELVHVRSKEDRRIAEEIANRERCIDFEKFKPLFLQLQRDLDMGFRKTISYMKRPEIFPNSFFIVGGQKAYIASVGERFIQEYGISDARLRIIFDNGTESKMLMRSFQRALANDKAGRQISDPNLGPLFTSDIEGNDEQCGYIYVLRSKSNLPRIADNRELTHKIGVTTNTIKKRIANAKDDPTFLMADVEVVASYKLFNINPKKLEHLIQRIFGSVRLDIQISDRFGKSYSPQEWFMVPLQTIDTAVERIKDGTITRYRFDPLTARLIERSDFSK